MNPFVQPYSPPSQDSSNMPEYLRPPKNQPPVDPVHRRRAWGMIVLFGMVIWIGASIVFQWYYSRQIKIQLEESRSESEQISERIQHQIDKKLKESGIE